MRLMAVEVQVDVDGGVMVVTVNRPQARNAITRPVAEAIAAGHKDFDHMRQDSDLTPLHGLPEFENLFPKPAQK